MARNKNSDTLLSLTDAIAPRLTMGFYYAKASLLILLLALSAVAFAQPDLSTRTYFGGFTHTLNPELGSYPTFSRQAGSSNGKVRDAFGAWQDALPGEARFVGANRVANLIPDSEAFGTSVWWTDPNASSYVTKGNALATPNPLAPGRNTIIPFTRTNTSSGPLLILRSKTYQVLPHVFSIVIDGDNTSGNVKVSFVHSSDGAVVSSYVVTPTPGANRYCFPMSPIDTTNHKVEIALTNNGVQQLAVGTAQMEAAYLQTGTCNNYVSRGVPGGSYPYQGAGVDGVQYFETINHWTYVPTLMGGGNRVTNLIPDSESFGTVQWWTDPYVTKGYALATTNPLTPGQNTIIPFTRTSASSGALLTFRSRSYKVLPYVFSIVIDGDNTSGDVKVSFVHSSDAAVVSSYVVMPKPGANRYCFPMTPIDTTNHKIELALTNNGVQQLAVGTAQLEDVTSKPAVCNDYVPSAYAVQIFDTFNQWAYEFGNYGLVTPQIPTPITLVPSNYGLVTQQTPNQIDPAALKGILLEPSSANKLLYNNTFSNPIWEKTGVAITDKIDSPYGPKTLTKLVEDGSVGSHGVSQAYCKVCAAPNSSTTSVTISAVVQSAERNWAYLEVNSGTNVVGYAYYDLLNGRVGSFSGQYANADIWAEGSAWRISLTVDAGASWASYPGNASARLYAATGDGSITYQGIPNNGLYIGVMQWETNEMATSYTGDQSASANVRNSDSMTITTASVLPATTNFTISLDMTSWFYTATAAKSNWIYVVNAAYDRNNTFGLEIKPGEKAGFPSMLYEWDCDYYLNSTNWDGMHLTYIMHYGDNARAIFTFGSTPINGNSGSGLLIGDTYGVPYRNQTQTTMYNALMSTYITLGAYGNRVVRHPMSYKNLSIFPNQFTKADSVLWSQMP